MFVCGLQCFPNSSNSLMCKSGLRISCRLFQEAQNLIETHNIQNNHRGLSPVYWYHQPVRIVLMQSFSIRILSINWCCIVLYCTLLSISNELLILILPILQTLYGNMIVVPYQLSDIRNCPCKPSRILAGYFFLSYDVYEKVVLHQLIDKRIGLWDASDFWLIIGQL